MQQQEEQRKKKKEEEEEAEEEMPLPAFFGFGANPFDFTPSGFGDTFDLSRDVNNILGYGRRHPIRRSAVPAVSAPTMASNSNAAVENAAPPAPDSPLQPAEDDTTSITPKKKVTFTTEQPKPPTLQAEDYSAPTGGKTDDVKGDLSTIFGFGNKNAKDMMKKQEFSFDNMVQRPFGETVEDREDESEKRTRKQEKKQRGAKNVEQYESLFVSKGNWCLFDPIKGFPTHLGEPYQVYKTFAYYKPGNARIVEFNTNSFSIRTKTTPENLQGKAIEYTEYGPRVVDIVEPIRVKGSSRKHPQIGRVGGATVGSLVEPATGGGDGKGRKSRVVKLAVKKAAPEEEGEDEGEVSDVMDLLQEVSSEME